MPPFIQREQAAFQDEILLVSRGLQNAREPQLEWYFHKRTIHLSTGSDRNEWSLFTDCHLDVLHMGERKTEEWHWVKRKVILMINIQNIYTLISQLTQCNYLWDVIPIFEMESEIASGHSTSNERTWAFLTHVLQITES